MPRRQGAAAAGTPQVVEAARPLAVRAEESELEAMRLRQLAADTEFHGEVGRVCVAVVCVCMCVCVCV